MKLRRRIDRVFILVLIGIGIAALTLYAIFGKTIRATQPPMIAYLGNPLDASEIWLAAADGSSSKQLTATGGMVYDFTVSPDGEKILYSVHKADGSSGLYVIGSGGGDAKLLVDCGDDRCEKPAWSNDGQYIAYSQFGNLDGAATRVVAIYPNDGAATTPWVDLHPTGTNPVFSPDSQKLAMNNPEEGFIRILDLASGIERHIPASTPDPVVWAVDSKHLYFNENSVIGEILQSRLYRVELASLQVEPFLPALLASYDTGGLAFSSDGEWLVLGLRGLDYRAGRQVYIARVDGSQFQAVSNDPGTTYSGFRWSPDGNRLVFQRFTAENLNAVPQVVVWVRTIGIFVTVAENGALPAWVP